MGYHGSRAIRHRPDSRRIDGPRPLRRSGLGTSKKFLPAFGSGHRIGDCNRALDCQGLRFHRSKDAGRRSIAPSHLELAVGRSMYRLASRVPRCCRSSSQLKSSLELHDSRVSRIELADGMAMIYFSHAYIHKSPGAPGRDHGTGWSQEARLVLSHAAASGPLPALPNTISEGFLEVGGIRHELVPLPFRRRVHARLNLVFVDDFQMELTGERPYIELLGGAIYLENVP